MTIVVSSIDELGQPFKKLGISLGKIQERNFGKIVQVSDPDGNSITFAEPPKNFIR